MPTFTNPWDDTKPLDTELADLLGGNIRALKLDIQERMNAELFVDFTADPLVIQDKVAGVRTGAQCIVPFASFLSDLHSRENDITDGNLTVFTGSGGLFAALPSFLVGCTVTKVEWLVDIFTATSLDLDFRSSPFVNTPGASTTLDHKNIAVAGQNIVSSGFTLAVPIVGDVAQFYLRVLSNGGAGTNGVVYGARITYNRPA